MSTGHVRAVSREIKSWWFSYKQVTITTWRQEYQQNKEMFYEQFTTRFITDIKTLRIHCTHFTDSILICLITVRSRYFIRHYSFLSINFFNIPIIYEIVA